MRPSQVERPGLFPTPRHRVAASRQDCVASCFKELQSLFHERLVVLEDAPMPGILIEDELGVRKAARQVDRVAAGHHLRSEEHTSELQSQSNLVCRLLLEKKKNPQTTCYCRNEQ